MWLLGVHVNLAACVGCGRFHRSRFSPSFSCCTVGRPVWQPVTYTQRPLQPLLPITVQDTDLATALLLLFRRDPVTSARTVATISISRRVWLGQKR